MFSDLKKIDPNSTTHGGTTALMIAANDPAKIKILLKRGANPKATTKTGYDALMFAALFYGNSKSVNLLLQSGIPASSSRQARFGASSLAHAVMSNDPAMVRLLLAKGANPKQMMGLLGSPQPNPMINLALGFNNVLIIRHLAKAGALIDEPDWDGMTALSWAAVSLHAESVKVLLDLGADPKHKNKFGLTPPDHVKTVADAPAAEVIRLFP